MATCILWSFLLLFLNGAANIWANKTSNTKCSTVYLLHIAASAPNPFGFDVGIYGADLLSYGEVATQYINDDPSLLPGYQLKLIGVSSQSCFHTYLDIFKGLAKSKFNCVFGIVGLYSYCEAVAVARNLDHSEFGYVQLSSSTSTTFNNLRDYRYLFRVVSSNEVYASAAVELFASLNWTKFSISYDADSFESITTSIALAVKVNRKAGIEILLNAPLRTQSLDGYGDLYSRIISHESKIVVHMMSRWQAAGILCEGYHRNLLWPILVHIFVEQSPMTIYSTSNTSCSRNELTNAMEGVIFIRQKLFVDSNTTLVSGKSYEVYQHEVKMTKSISGDIYMLGNTLHDQIWAFALAMNRSLSRINTNINLSFHEVVRKTPAIRKAIADELRSIRFQGASSEINFGKLQESKSLVNIIQVRNATEVVIGTYIPEADLIIYQNSFNRNSFPSDSFGTVYYEFPLWLQVSMTIMLILLVCVTLIIIVGHIYWKRRPEIKSTSFKISIIILFGCLLILVTSALRTVSVTFELPEYVTTIFCNGEFWLFYMGISMVAASLYFRLLRIYCFFHTSHVIKKHWSDHRVLLYISIVCSITLTFLVVWVVLDPLRPVSRLTFIHEAEFPHYSKYLYCSSRTMLVWFVLLAAWASLILITVIVLAVMTRHVPISNFKDTKKVNVFVISVLVMFSASFAFSHFLDAIDLVVIAQALRWFMQFSIVILCHFCIFLPKFMPILQRQTSSPRKQTYAIPTTDNVRYTENTVL